MTLSPYVCVHRAEETQPDIPVAGTNHVELSQPLTVAQSPVWTETEVWTCLVLLVFNLIYFNAFKSLTFTLVKLAGFF